MTELPITELVVAFIFILATSFAIYVLGRFLSPKPVQSENAQSAYACGEKASFVKLRVNVSLYKYLIYCLSNVAYYRRTDFHALPFHNARVWVPSSRRRRPLTCCASLKQWARLKSPWVLHFNSGACNGCDIEVIALLTPRYDVERLGILLEPSPRHADVLLTTGVVTQQCADRLKRIYDQMPEPKFVVAIGACACSGGVFEGNYTVLGGVDKVIPVDAYIPGCPPKPEAIMDGVLKLLQSAKKEKSNDNY
jgi:ech hydrogenase subunit C